MSKVACILPIYIEHLHCFLKVQTYFGIYLNFILFFNIFYFLCMNFCLNICTPFLCPMPKEARKVHQILGNMELLMVLRFWCGCKELNPGLLQEQLVLWTLELFFQPLFQSLKALFLLKRINIFLSTWAN